MGRATHLSGAPERHGEGRGRARAEQEQERSRSEGRKRQDAAAQPGLHGPACQNNNPDPGSTHNGSLRARPASSTGRNPTANFSPSRRRGTESMAPRAGHVMGPSRPFN
ncbi:hypothetical protein AGOR_G00075580 [Albula goreensis]|uniref:Uncharacterized protein n=1 Tax=Albula goreensis TaxID=1534307 RepID=A0A8T3DMP2_9TELE|nr:hypothetical protein AGOR_G00075580 [Albula goreensis]